jgi:hypothetical protein
MKIRNGHEIPTDGRRRKLMPKFRFLADVDSVVDEAEHLESIFEDGIEAESEDEALKIVEKKVKELMYGGPYYSVTDEED